MILERVDLYGYFGLARNGAEKAFLTGYRHSQMEELGVERIRPAMLVLPGGGYAFCSQREAEPVAMRYYTAGYDAFVLDYDIAPFCYPTQMLQAGMAMLYLHREAEALGIDRTKVAAIGFSAGGHLCGCLGLLWDDAALRAQFGAECADIRPDAILLSYPVVSCEKSIGHVDSFKNFCGTKVRPEDYSLERKARSDAPPCFFWTTSTDAAVPVENSVLLYTALHRAGVATELHIFDAGPHGMATCDVEVYAEAPKDLDNAHAAHWLELSLEFLQKQGFCLCCKDKR